MVDLAKWFFLDGEWVRSEDAKVSIVTHSLHYGLAVFEGIRCYKTAAGPAIFRLKEHAKRFIDSCKIVHMPIDFDQAKLESLLTEAVRRNELDECYLRPLAYYSTEKVGLSTQGMRGHLAVVAWKWGAYLGADGLTKGIRVMTSSYTRHHPNITMTRAKVSGNYLNSQLAKLEAVSHGYAEALMLDPEGYVVEGSGENLFMVEDGTLITPPQGSILNGITRASVLTLARDNGIPVREERLTRDRLMIADEVFFTGSAAEVTPIREIDREPVADGVPGPITMKLQDLYFKAIRGELDGYERWLGRVE